MTITDALSSANGSAPPALVAQPRPGAPTPGRRVLRTAIWLPGLAVALGAAVATAHGLYEVAVAARVPAGIAWLYPLITDGLALVAYAATARLTDGGRRYAWAVVILAAGLSGLAQAAYLATDAPTNHGAAGAPGAVGFVAPAALRFGVGAWPAIAAAIVAHLLYLLAADHYQSADDRAHDDQRSTEAVQPQLFNGGRRSCAVQSPLPVNGAPVLASGVQPEHPATGAPVRLAAPVQRPDGRALPSPARDRARAAAQRHVGRHGMWPTVTELETAAEVSRGTAAAALKHLREHADPELPEPGGTATTDEETQR